METEQHKEIISLLETLRLKGYIDEFIIEQFQDKIISLNDPYLSLNFVLLFQPNNLLNIRKHEQIVLKSKDLMCNYQFARYVGGANVKAHWVVIGNSNDAFWIDKFNTYDLLSKLLNYKNINDEEKTNDELMYQKLQRAMQKDINEETEYQKLQMIMKK